MSESPLTAVVGRLVRGLPSADGTADAALLARFVAWRDEAAFELLVHRHGPMVRGICRRLLRHEQDAEDAFQATFLALARRAAMVRGQSLAGWLYRVAFHAALKARAARQRATALPEVAAPAGCPSGALQEREAQAVVDEEVMRLPERFRLPVVLCYLEGRTTSEAAAGLGVPKGTVDSRLARARAKLKGRLVRRGLAPAAAAATLESTTTAAELPAPVARAVAKAAVAYLSHQPTAGVVPAGAAILAEGVLHTMFVTKLKHTLTAVLALALLGSGLGVATFGNPTGAEQLGPVAAPAAELPPGRPKGPAAAGTHPAKTADGLRALLREPAGLDSPLEATSLREALNLLADRFDVTIRIDPAACARRFLDDPFEMYNAQVQLPVVRNLTFGQVLHDLLAQVRTSKDKGNLLVPLTYLVKGSQIVIVPAYMVPFPRTLFDEGQGFEPLLNPNVIEDQVQGDPVSVACQNQPLADVLRELGDGTGANVVLDGRVKEKGQTPVTANLQNVRLFTALRVLADMADLQPTTVGNVYYVTTKENADRLHREEWKKPAAGSSAPATPPAASPVPGKQP